VYFEGMLPPELKELLVSVRDDDWFIVIFPKIKKVNMASMSAIRKRMTSFFSMESPYRFE
jgi:hypothetical protein